MVMKSAMGGERKAPQACPMFVPGDPAFLKGAEVRPKSTLRIGVMQGPCVRHRWPFVAEIYRATVPGSTVPGGVVVVHVDAKPPKWGMLLSESQPAGIDGLVGLLRELGWLCA